MSKDLLTCFLSNLIFICKLKFCHYAFTLILVLVPQKVFHAGTWFLVSGLWQVGADKIASASYQKALCLWLAVSHHAQSSYYETSEFVFMGHLI